MLNRITFSNTTDISVFYKLLWVRFAFSLMSFVSHRTLHYFINWPWRWLHLRKGRDTWGKACRWTFKSGDQTQHRLDNWERSRFNSLIFSSSSTSMATGLFWPESSLAPAAPGDQRDRKGGLHKWYTRAHELIPRPWVATKRWWISCLMLRHTHTKRKNRARTAQCE